MENNIQTYSQKEEKLKTIIKQFSDLLNYERVNRFMQKCISLSGEKDFNGIKAAAYINGIIILDTVDKRSLMEQLSKI